MLLLTLAGAGKVIADTCQFLNNLAEQGRGGALYLAPKVTGTLRSSVFEGNRAHEDGGAVWSSSGNLFAANSTFKARSAGNPRLGLCSAHS